MPLSGRHRSTAPVEKAHPRIGMRRARGQHNLRGVRDRNFCLREMGSRATFVCAKWRSRNSGLRLRSAVYENVRAMMAVQAIALSRSLCIIKGKFRAHMERF
jgi:hypothetical protein